MNRNNLESQLYVHASSIVRSADDVNVCIWYRPFPHNPLIKDVAKAECLIP